MTYLVAKFNPHSLALNGFVIGSLILAYAPIRWLITTWLDPSYQSSAGLYLAVLGALIGWSISSERTHGNNVSQALALKLLFAAALLRLLSQVAAINIIGGLALALDVFALLTWLGLAERRRAVSPFWASVLFLFTLPFERILQRLLGYPMQEISAFSACNMLAPFFDDLVCEGVRLRVAGQDVLVDLPCSGTTSLMLGLCAIVCLNALFRPSLFRAACLIALTIVLAILGNALRISLLAIGLIHESTTGIDVMAQPFHDVIGYFTLLVSLAPILWVCGTKIEATPTPAQTPISASASSAKWMPAASIAFVATAVLIISMPRQALDVSRQLPPTSLPMVINGEIKRDEPLTDIEQRYFSQFGGTAQKALYGPMAVTVVQTTSPLRHLHAPDDCLRGLGYTVRFVGTRFEPVPVAIYKAEDQDGRAWKVTVTFISASGFATSNVAEAIWHWFKAPGTQWQSVQRITPWSLDDATRDQFETAAIAALDLTSITN